MVPTLNSGDTATSTAGNVRIAPIEFAIPCSSGVIGSPMGVLKSERQCVTGARGRVQSCPHADRRPQKDRLARSVVHRQMERHCHSFLLFSGFSHSGIDTSSVR